MKDQIDALAARSIAARRLDSTLSVAEYREVMEKLRSGDLRLLYVAPERFNNERFRESLARVRVSLFAVGEAHCISEWGHNFRPDYLELAEFARACGAERVLAPTATATGKVLEDFAYGDTPSLEAIRGLVAAVFSGAMTWSSACTSFRRSTIFGRWSCAHSGETRVRNQGHQF